jgi:hypothetical protein
VAKNNESHQYRQQIERRRLRRNIRPRQQKRHQTKDKDNIRQKENPSSSLLRGLPATPIREVVAVAAPSHCLSELRVCGNQGIDIAHGIYDIMVEGENCGGNIGGKNIPSRTKKKLIALECDTFRDDVRAEWIRAVFGTEFPQRKSTGKVAATALAAATTTDSNKAVTQKNYSWKGVGLAGISSYVAYTADLELPRTTAPSSSFSPRPKTVLSMTNSAAIAGNSHCNNGSDANHAMHTTTENMENDKKAKNENVPQTSLLVTESQQASLGMTLSRLSLGLYVRSVRPGSEAWCAGVEENSVLVGINDGELNLLAEPSKSALERIWQYEGYYCASIENAGAKDKASEEKNNASNSDGTANTKMKIRDPISMTFIRGGKLYKVLFLSNPPYGIDWGPCGKFCLIQRVKAGGIADLAGVRPSSIVAKIFTEGNDEGNEVQDKDRNQCYEKNTIYHLDHSSVATILKEATTACVRQQQIQNNHSHKTIRIQLCFPPSEARSGHWERQQDDLEENKSGRGKSGANNSTASSNIKTIRLPQHQLPRPRVVAELDGVQVRIHPLLGGRGNMVSCTGRPDDTSSRRSRSPNNHRNSRRYHSGFGVPPSSSLSKLAERVAAGENLSIFRNSGNRNHQELCGINSFSSLGAEYGRFYRPCPILKNSSSSSEINTNTQQSSSNKQLSPPSSLSPSILDCWDVQQAFIYVFRHHLAGYNEMETRVRASEDTDFLKVLGEYLPQSQSSGNCSKSTEIATISDALSTFLIFWFGWLTAQDNKPLDLTEYLLKLVHQNQIIKNHVKKIPVGVDGDNFSLKSSSYSLAHHMEFLAGAFDNGDIKMSLRKLRKDRQQRQYIFKNTSQRIDGNSNMLPSIRAVTGTTPTHHESSLSKESKLDGTFSERRAPASVSAVSVKPRSRRLFRFFRKKKRRRDKKKSSDNSNITSVHATIGTKKKSSPIEKTSVSSDDKTESLPSVTGGENFSASMRSKSKSPASPKSPSMILKELSKVTLSQSTDSLFGNTLSFLGELELVCADIEKSLMRSFSQQFARWALQPWTANNESTLANVTNTMRERLKLCNQNSSSMPLLDPIDSSSEPLSSIDSDECYILPSAHFPLLLTFDCKKRCNQEKHIQFDSHSKSKESRDCQVSNRNTNSILYGEERIYRTTVELIALKGSRVVENNEKLPTRGFTVHGSVSGSVVESQQSVGVDQESNNHIWNKANFMVFDSRSTWGPPQTLSLRLSEAIIEPTERETNASIDSSLKECSYCWVNLTPYWDQSTDKREPQYRSKIATKPNTENVTCKARVVPCDAFKDFNEHGDLPENYLPENMELIEIELQITTKILEAKSTVKRSLLYKHDDDVRQEMFAIEFIKSCDRILRSCGLDMKMLIYQCISVGKNRGFMEWVQGSVPLSEICQPFAGSILAKNRDKNKKSKSISIENSTSEAIDQDYGDDDDDNDDNITLSSVAKAGMTNYESLSRLRADSISSPKPSNTGSNYVLPNNNNPIQDFLRSFAYDPDGSYKIKREAMDTYAKSCAGYSVCTFILGVGDRHLDNLLLHQSGHFFHCDYSFILGKDPKKYLPMRITQDMINGMGGWRSDNFCQFLSLACAAFLTLRRPENVRHLLSLIRLLEGCGLPDLEKTQSIETSIQGVRDRLKLDLSDEEAIVFMEKLIQDSCSSKMWIAVDAIHSLAQKLK